MNTPIQNAIISAENKITGTNKTLDQHFISVANGLKKLLPYEKQFAEEMFNAGYKRGEDQKNVVDKVEGQVFPDFKTLYSKYEK